MCYKWETRLLEHFTSAYFDEFQYLEHDTYAIHMSCWKTLEQAFRVCLADVKMGKLD